MNNRAAWLTKKEQIEIRSADVHMPADDEVMVRVEYVGICGSDMHFYETGCFSKGPIPFPHILGHECAGTVVQVGNCVKTLRVGDRVAIEPGKPCGECELCKSGRYNLCHDIQFKSVPPYHGVMQDYVTHKASLCFPLPESVSTLEGALIEPFAIGLYAAKRAEVTEGKTVVILGAGCIGMMSIMACKALGAKEIIAVDIFESRLKKSLEIGASHTVNSQKANALEAISALTQGSMADIVFETAGSATTLNLAPSICKSGGTIMMVGNVFGNVSFNFWEVAHREITMKSIYRYCNIYPLAIQLVADKKVDLTTIVNDIEDLEQANHAFQQAISDKEHTLKGVIKLI